MNYSTPDRADALAAQYVLGTLSPRARARLTRLLRTDGALADAVRVWEERLLPLTEGVPPVTPPARVWQAVATRIWHRGAPASEPMSVWAKLNLWRGLTLAGFATAMALAFVLLSPPPQRPEGSLVAVLGGKDAIPVLVASADRDGRFLTIKALATIDLAADRALELWALPEKGNPRSLGLIASSGVVRVALRDGAASALRDIPALAVSLEPKGGSPTGLPTGPVLYSGTIQRLY